MRSVAFAAVAALPGCGDSSTSNYSAAIECYAAQSAIFDGAKQAGVELPVSQAEQVRAAIAIYRDRAVTLAREDGGDARKVEADVIAYLKDFATRYEASSDKPAMDKAMEETLKTCAETLA